MTTLELGLLSLIGGLIILFPFWVAFLLWHGYRRHQKAYPQAIPGYKVRMVGSPFSGEEAKRALEMLEEEWLNTYSHTRKQIRKKINNLSINWVPGRINDNGKLSRTMIYRTGKVISGVHLGNHISVVFLESDDISDTVFVHEVCHELKEMDGQRGDGTHSDEKLWENRYHPERIEKGLIEKVNEKLKALVKEQQ